MLQTLIDISQEAGKKALDFQQQLDPSSIKEASRYAGDLQTQADVETQRIVVSRLQHYFPAIPIVGEEDEHPQITAPTFFFVDPIDGTLPYVHNCPEWGVNIGYVEQRELVLSVQYLPALEMLITAEKGKGCYLNGKLVKLSHTNPLSKTLINIGAHPSINLKIHQDISTPLIYASNGCRTLASCIGGTLELLQGRVGAFMNYKGYIWDYPGALAVQEAGGVALAVDGSALNWTKIPMGVLFAASSDLAEEMLKYTRKIKEFREYREYLQQ